MKNVTALSNKGEAFRGTLHLTSHHLIFAFTVPNKTASPKASDAKTVKSQTRETWITYHIIAHCAFRPTPHGSGQPSSIRLRCRDFVFFTFNFDDQQQAREVFESIRSLTCRLGAIDKLYAFSYAGNKHEQAVNGWDFYDPKAEWKRQGISEKGVDRGWRISKINTDYGFSPTYPALLVVPTTISDNVINYAGRFRSKVRIPALTYLHPVNNCSITRSAQPMTGIRNNRSVQDERLLHACFTASGQRDGLEIASVTHSAAASTTSLELQAEEHIIGSEKLEDELIDDVSTDEKATAPTVYGAQQHNKIFDARPVVNARAMQAVGLGSENMDNYQFATKVYLGIENIHVMRDSLAKVIEAIKDSDLTPLPPNRDLLAKSGWLKHITCLLDGSALIARQVGIHHSNVLIHCSDGWDRTSQLSALSQIMLDPYYRTLDGFIVLVEKDWLSFGHMFQHRNGYLNSEKWFVTQSDGLAGTSIKPGDPSSSPGGDAIENALSKARSLFGKKPVMSDEFDSDGEPIPIEDLSPSKKNGKDSLASQEATKPKETSPVFHQFLDCVYQLLQQHPTRFEFNERFLKRLLYHLYSCQYGTFLYNSEKSRHDANVRSRTRSVWDYFLSARAGFINDKYDGGSIDDNERGHERLIFPDLQKVKWWHEVFNRTDDEMNGPVNHQTEKYLSGSAKGLGAGVVTGVETAHAAAGAGTTRNNNNDISEKSSHQNSSGAFGGIKDSFSNLSIGNIGMGTLGMGSGAGNGGGNKSPAGKRAMEVEMQ